MLTGGISIIFESRAEGLAEIPPDTPSTGEPLSRDR
jgi:hypothetical protein